MVSHLTPLSAWLYHTYTYNGIHILYLYSCSVRHIRSSGVQKTILKPIGESLASDELCCHSAGVGAKKGADLLRFRFRTAGRPLQFRASNGDAKNIENYWCFHICPPLPISRLSKQVEKGVRNQALRLLPRPRPRQLPRRKQRRRRLWGVSNFVQKWGIHGHTGTPQNCN